MESGDVEAPVRYSSELHWGCGGCKEGVCPEGGGGGECGDVCEGLSRSISGSHDMQPVAGESCRLRGRRVSRTRGSVAWQPLLAVWGGHR